MLSTVGIEPRPLIASDSKSNTIMSTLTLHSLVRLRLWDPYIVMLYWFLLNPSKSKYQVVHEQKFKDLLSNTWQVSVERLVLNLESEAMRGRGSIPTVSNILSLDFFGFHVVKTKMPQLAFLCVCEKPYCWGKDGPEENITGGRINRAVIGCEQTLAVTDLSWQVWGERWSGCGGWGGGWGGGWELGKVVRLCFTCDSNPSIDHSVRYARILAGLQPRP